MASSSQKWELVLFSFLSIQGAGRTKAWRLSEQYAHEWAAWLAQGRGFPDTEPLGPALRKSPASLPELGK